MPKISKELLDHAERPSLLDSLLLSRKDPKPQTPESWPSFAPLPESQVLGKVKEFLEVMAKANQDLELRAKENPYSNCNIEVLNDSEKEYIEMDLLLGVTDLLSDEAVTAAEASIFGFQPTVASSNCGSSDCYYDGCDDDDNENNNCSHTTFKHAKKFTKHLSDADELSMEAKRNKRPKIVMLDPK